MTMFRDKEVINSHRVIRHAKTHTLQTVQTGLCAYFFYFINTLLIIISQTSTHRENENFFFYLYLNFQSFS